MFQGHILQCEGKHVYISAHYFEDFKFHRVTNVAYSLGLLLLYMAGTMMLYTSYISGLFFESTFILHNSFSEYNLRVSLYTVAFSG